MHVTFMHYYEVCVVLRSNLEGHPGKIVDIQTIYLRMVDFTKARISIFLSYLE